MDSEDSVSRLVQNRLRSFIFAERLKSCRSPHQPTKSGPRKAVYDSQYIPTGGRRFRCATLEGGYHSQSYHPRKGTREMKSWCYGRLLTICFERLHTAPCNQVSLEAPAKCGWAHGTSVNGSTRSLTVDEKEGTKPAMTYTPGTLGSCGIASLFYLKKGAESMARLAS